MVGDLGNVDVADDGSCAVHIEDSLVKLIGPHSIIGRSLVVFAGEDDETSADDRVGSDELDEGVLDVDGAAAVVGDVDVAEIADHAVLGVGGAVILAEGIEDPAGAPAGGLGEGTPTDGRTHVRPWEKSPKMWTWKA
mmetsp:Transcript_28130/g.90681  ORF Transcript_28130/g.90681 Transcript_28130/m.90681 type:complete len:137 (+) Transcript_28130:377-787(+)